MTSLNAHNIDKPIDPQTKDSLTHPDTGHVHGAEPVTKALYAAVDASETDADVQTGIHAPINSIFGNSFVQKWVPGLQDLAAKYHVGNYVLMRGTGEKFFESMPLYPRLGMHLLYYGEEQISFLKNKTVGGILADLSQRQGSTYDSPDSVKSIPSFISTYSIQVSELRFPDLSHYKSFNEFFYRQLREDARPIQNADDPDGFCSAADCRLTVYQTCELAREFWVKGNNFTIPNLLGISPESDTAHTFSDASLAIFRLAPADYHRFHCPLDGLVGWDSGDNTEGITDIPGEYFTVNPQAVNEPGFDVFTANRRAVLYLKHEKSGLPVAFVAIGAMLVGSIEWTGGKERGRRVKKGDELGYFAYGGSTVIAVFPKGLIQFDADLIKASNEKLETLMKVGYSLGTKPTA